MDFFQEGRSVIRVLYLKILGVGYQIRKRLQSHTNSSISHITSLHHTTLYGEGLCALYIQVQLIHTNCMFFI